MSQKKAHRFLWADLTRVLAIYLVVVVHTSTVVSTNVASIALFALAKTCVPLFVMLSGALLLGKREPNTVFFKKRVDRVLIPWIFWTGVYLVWNWYFFHTNLHTLSNVKYQIELTFLTRFWFLPMIFGLYLITPFLRLATVAATKKDIIFICAIWFIFMSILPFIHNSLAFPILFQSGLALQVLQYSGYFLLGFLLSFFTLQKKHMILVTVIFVLALLWIVILTVIHSKTQVNFTYVDYLSPGIVTLSAALFSLLVQLGNVWEKAIGKRVLQGVQTLSTASFGILLLHQIILDAFGKQLHTFFSTLDASFVGLTEGAVVFFVCFVIIFLLQRIPLLKRFAT